MTAHLGLRDPAYNRLLRQSEQSQLAVTNDQLETAAPSQATAEQWIQLSNNLHYLLVSTCDGPASTICRQNTQGDGFETWRLIHARYSIPLGTRSIGYLKPQLDEQKFDESFTSWEFQLSKYEQDNHTLLMQSKPQYCSMRQKDHYSNTYSYKQDTAEQHHHPTGYKQSH